MTQSKLVGLVHNPRVSEAIKLAQALERRLSALGCACWVASALEVDGPVERISDTSVVITVGGDGTILRTARLAAPHGVPILGVNLGRVGFMTELSPEDSLQSVPEYLNGDAWVEERAMIMATVLPGGAERDSNSEETLEPFHALNDVVVGRGAVSRLVEVETRIDGALLTTYRADGVIVSTATGTTGYGLSVGGPIFYPQSQDMLLKPMAPHRGLGAALVLHADSVIKLSVHADGDASVSGDGFMDQTLSSGDAVRITRSPHSARFLRANPPAQFYATLMQRLGLDVGNWPRTALFT